MGQMADISLLLAFALQATAPENSLKDSGELWKICTSDSDTKRELCRGYVIGALDTSEAIFGSEPVYCLPINITYQQIYFEVLSGLSKAREWRGVQSNQIILASLQRKWPCSKNDQKTGQSNK